MLSMLAGAAALAQSVYEFNLPQQPLADALRAIGRQTNMNILFEPETVKQLTAPAVHGLLSPEEAIKRVLAGTKLVVEQTETNSLLITRAAANATSKSSSPSTGAPGDGPSGGSSQRRLAQSGSNASRESSNKAAEEASSEDSSSVVKLQEVIVTAEKRAENLQDVPISMAVLSGEDLGRRSVVGMEDYLRSIPGVNEIDNGARGNAIVIRGVSTSPESENAASGTGPTVGTYFDETSITGAAGYTSGGIDLRPVDLERIEVLRGPQGTAYGDSALGGALRLIPAKPKLDSFDAKVAVSYSDTARYGGSNSMAQAVFNIPLIQDQLAVRAVGYHYDESGIYKNIAGTDPATLASAAPFGLTDYIRGFTQNDVGRMLTTGVRVAVAWQPTDKLNLTATFLRQTIEQDGLPDEDTGFYEQERIPDPQQFRLNGDPGEANDTNIDLSNLVLNYDLDWAKLTSVVSRVESGSHYAATLAVAPTFFTGGARSNFGSTTAETRLASHFQGPFQFLGGLYYEDVQEHSVQTTYWPGPSALDPFGPNPQLGNYDFLRGLTQRAVFGQLSYELIDKLTATVGGRYFKYGKDQSILRDGALYGAPAGTGVRQYLDSLDSGGSTFSANLSYKATADALVYLAWAQGFRLGQPEPGLPSTCDTNHDGLVDGTNLSIASTRKIDSDSLDNYELGGKFAFFDRRLTLDASVYHILWRSVPIRTNAPAPCTFAYVANAGEATSDGAEFQASLLVVKGLQLDVGAAFTNAHLSKDAPGLLPPAYAGDRLPGSPRVNANLSAQYSFNLVGFDTFVRADSSYIGKFYGDLLQSPLTAAGDYTKIDARAGITVIRNLSVEAFVRNLTNEDAYTWRGLSNVNSVFGYRMRPRTVGVQLEYHFQ
jgi:outer membrane receptor protein involved in Fe transport